MGRLLMTSALALRFDRVAMIRMLVAGTVWGLTLSAGFLINALLNCGPPCPEDIAAVTAACIGIGILTIGPLAALASPR
jgi:hypothetical protein